MTVESVFNKFSAILSNKAILNTVVAALAICFGLLLLAGLLRLISGKRGTVVGSVTVTFDILILYLMFALLPTILPITASYIPALPFAAINYGNITIMHIQELGRDLFCAQLIELIIIAFVFGLIEYLLPEGKNFILSLLLRLVSLIIVYIAICLIHWLSATILPGFVQSYAPILLLAFVAVLLALTVFKWFFGLILGFSCGPVIGGIYTFIVGNIVGKQLAKAAISCFLIVVLLFFACNKGFTTVNSGSFPQIIRYLILTIPFIARYLISKFF